MTLKEEILALTKQLVAVPSVNGTVGERNLALFIERYLREIPYFQEHPDQVIVQELSNDPLGRRNVFALLKGEKRPCGDTILLHGHMDTVGVEDYGALKDCAFSCDALKERLSRLELPEEVRADLASGDWLFGRGACDMKGGVAVFLVLLRHLSERAGELSGNLLLSVNPVEENLHTGIIEALEVLERLQKEEGLRYLFAVNNDYMCPAFPGDTTRYVYSGAVGKLLPCFYILGKETHVGQCFEGFDASMIAAELVRIINLNPDFCDGYNEEYSLPPSVLKLQDLKPEYNVQTACSAFLYFNLFVHNRSVPDILKLLKNAAGQALENVLASTNGRYRAYCALSGMEFQPIDSPRQVLEYAELFRMAERSFAGNLEEETQNMAAELLAKGEDKRSVPLKIAERLCEIAQVKTPTIVVFFAAPYCPHNTLKSEEPQERALLGRITELAEAFGRENGETFRVMQFFPSLSDSSYLKIDDDTRSLETLIGNFPAYSRLYPLPFERIRGLNIAGLDYGCFGKDAHKWTERVYIPYSFGVLPKLVLKTIEEFLMK